jgi:UDP-glucose 4-epimerase
MQVLITGVAGYIGAHVANIFLEKGYEVIGIDNFSFGFESFVDPRINLVQGDIQDSSTCNKAFSLLKKASQSGVIHCAGIKFAGESVKKPLDFYVNNTVTTLQILKSMLDFGVPRLVFSSSCSVYGNPKTTNPIIEFSETDPVSPYGRSKKFAEDVIKDVSALGQIKSVALRYFNVAGNGNIAAHDRSPFNLFPNLYRAIQNNSDFEVFGNDYETFDGTAIRDYVDVNALGEAHYRVYHSLLMESSSVYEVYNLGSGRGLSVGQILEIAKENLSSDLKVVYKPRRKGDPSQISANIMKAQKDLKWEHKVDCKEMLMSGWNAWIKK